MGERFKELMADYGAIALTIYLIIFGGVLVGFAVAIRAGVEVDSAAGETGLWGAAWLATKVVQPIRIGATLVLTPIVGSVWHRMTGRGPAKLDATSMRPNGDSE